MANFIDEFMKNYGPELSKQMATTFKVDKSTAKKLIPELTPLILGGLKKQKDEQGGADRVNHILNKYGDQAALNNIKDLVVSKSRDKSPDARLGGLLGESGPEAARVLAKKFNIDASIIQKMIPVLSPLILGALIRQRDSSKSGLAGITSLLDSGSNAGILNDVAGFLLKQGGGSKAQAPDLMKTLGNILKKR